MNYIEHIKKAILYIEENLRYDIDLDTLALVSGYSPYHFLRIFKDTMHSTPAEYIRKRRLSEIVREMENSDKAISEIAFEYGFNSKENFTRAFKNEHHILPTEYKMAGNSLKLYDKPDFEKFISGGTQPFIVLPEIIECSTFLLTAYKSDEEFPPNFWNKYNCRKWSRRLSGGKICEDFGVSSWNPDKCKLDYFIGIKTEEAAGDTRGTVNIRIPEGSYAVFHTPETTHFNFVNTIHKTWDYINSVWITESPYKKTGGYEFECYIEESRIFREKIYIPIQK